MAAPTPRHPIAGNQSFEHFLEVLVNPKEVKERYDALKEIAALATQRIEQTVKVKALEGAAGRALANEKLAKEALTAAQKKAQGMIDEAEGVVSALYGDFAEEKTTHAAEYEKFQIDSRTLVTELGRREEAAATMREEAAAELLNAEHIFEKAKGIKADYEAKAAALDKAMGR